MKCFLALLLLCVNSVAKEIDLTFEEYKQHWQEWKSFYGKSYESEAENTARFSVWRENLKVTSNLPSCLFEIRELVRGTYAPE